MENGEKSVATRNHAVFPSLGFSSSERGDVKLFPLTDDGTGFCLSCASFCFCLSGRLCSVLVSCLGAPYLLGAFCLLFFEKLKFSQNSLGWLCSAIKVTVRKGAKTLTAAARP